MREVVRLQMPTGPVLWRERRMRELRDELATAGVVDCRWEGGGGVSPEPGTKGAVETVALLLGASAPIARPTIEAIGAVIRAWMERDRRTTVHVTVGAAELDITGDPSEAQLEALDTLLRHHASEGDAPP